ncbi:MAG TPA: hypothetical protein VF710_10340 [Longimicrobium sp.]|jgi:hypothetical protein
MHLLTTTRASSASRQPRKLLLAAMMALSFAGALAVPMQAFAQISPTTCVTTVTRYYIFGYEVYRSESTTCVHGDN